MLDVRRCLDRLVRNYKFVQSNPDDVARHDRMVSLVQQMLDLHKQLPQAGTPHEKTALERQIEATDGQIDGGPALWADGGGDKNRRGESDFIKNEAGQTAVMKKEEIYSNTNICRSINQKGSHWWEMQCSSSSNNEYKYEHEDNIAHGMLTSS